MKDKDQATLAAEKIIEIYSVGTFSNFCYETDFDSASVEEIAEIIRLFFPKIMTDVTTRSIHQRFNPETGKMEFSLWDKDGQVSPVFNTQDEVWTWAGVSPVEIVKRNTMAFESIKVNGGGK